MLKPPPQCVVDQTIRMCFSCSEHIALYLVNGRIMLKVTFGTETVRIKTEEKYNDGYWHLITFERKNLDLNLIVDGTIYYSEMYEISQTFSDLLFFYIGGLQVVS